MSRIEAVPERRAPLWARFGFWMSRRIVGRVTTPLAVAARNFWVYQAYGAFEYLLGRARTVEPRLKSLASLRAGSMVGCPF